MSKRSAAASAAAHAASKKNSVVELTAGDEERARQALQVTPAHASSGALALHSADVDAKRCVVQQLDLLVGPTQPQVSSSWDKDELVSQLSDLCDTLLAESFRWQDIQQALQVAQHTASCLFVAHSASAYPQGMSVLQAVPMEHMSEATVLDWLCLNVDPAYLPRRFDCTLATDVMAFSCLNILLQDSPLQVCWWHAVTSSCIGYQACGKGKREAKSCCQSGCSHHLT